MIGVHAAAVRQTVSTNAQCVNGCWQIAAPSESGVTADLGPAWEYFLLERHFRRTQCVGRRNVVRKMCDALAVPRQNNSSVVVFLEMKTSGQFADAMPQLRAGISKMIDAGLPSDAVIRAEIWYRREPKVRIEAPRIEKVAGRSVFVRHRKSE
jgi:hypothetical protein